jgi:hypothetical protein
MFKFYNLFFVTAICCYLIICTTSGQTKQSKELQEPVKNQNPEIADTLKSELPHSWLQNRVTFAEIDTIYGNAPAEDFRREYNEFKAKFQEGDELWYFCSPAESWGKQSLSGRAGYMIIRKGAVIATIVTLMN